MVQTKSTTKNLENRPNTKNCNNSTNKKKLWKKSKKSIIISCFHQTITGSQPIWGSKGSALMMRQHLNMH
jgi:hypothetical protein